MAEPGPQRVLVLNAGSSSLKYRVLDVASGTASVQGQVERVTDVHQALATVHDRIASAGVGEADLIAVGHRVVHGGARLVRPTLVDDDVLAEIENATRLAPLHNPPALAGIRSARAEYPHLPQVAVFDTAFFANLPAAAATYALDAEASARAGIRRYGAHGISHEYVAGEAARLLDRDPAELDQIVLHLGSGASAAAIRGGRPVDTSMGFTPLEGLVMSTRGGDLDPGILLHLLRHGGLDVDGLEELLHHRSGLAGLAGHPDFRDLLAALDAGDERARAAYDVYVHRLRKYVGAYLAVLGGADVLTFTGGVGQWAPRLRADSLAGLQPLGIEIDPERNTADQPGPRRISAAGSAVTVLVVPTDEELSIARQTLAVLG